MSVPAYSEYRDSGVPWLGKVPSHWDVKPFRYGIASIESGTSVNALDTPATDDEPAVLKTSCVYTGDFRSDENKIVVPEDIDRVTCPLKAGTLIVSRMNTPELVGAAGLVRETVPNLYLPDRLWQLDLAGLTPAFAHYWTRSRSYRGQVEVACAGTSSSMQNLSQSQLCGFLLPFPPLPEQVAIAVFLDRETEKIDALVTEQERLIALLKEKRQAVISLAVTKGLNPDVPMKDSGVEWLGEIPAHWIVVRLGNLYREAVRTGSDDLPILSVSIHRGVSDYEIPDEDMERNVARSEDRSKYRRVQPNDLVYNMMRAWQGGFGAVQIHGQVSPAYVVAEPTLPLRSEFIEALLRTPCAVEEMRRHSRGVTDFRLRLYWDEFKDLKVALPPSNEIDAILAVGAEMVMQFNALEEASRNAIALLQERRAALISATVTGKIDVRGLASQNNVVSIDCARLTKPLPSLRAVIGSLVIPKLGDKGRMAVMKGAYLAEAHCGMNDVGGRYQRYAAGPYDSGLIAAMERGADDLCGIKTVEPPGDGERVVYQVPQSARPLKAELEALVGEDRANAFNKMLSDLNGIGREGIEAVATIYAVWNDLIAAGKAARDDAICNGVLNDWHEEKRQKFKRTDLDHWLDWMRRNGFVPDGTAPRTDHQGSLFT